MLANPILAVMFGCVLACALVPTAANVLLDTNADRGVVSAFGAVTSPNARVCGVTEKPGAKALGLEDNCPTAVGASCNAAEKVLALASRLTVKPPSDDVPTAYTV